MHQGAWGLEIAQNSQNLKTSLFQRTYVIINIVPQLKAMLYFYVPGHGSPCPYKGT
jgi:hypothetical protein